MWFKRITLGVFAALLVQVNSSYAFELNAKAYYVGHPKTGSTILEKNADVKIGPASLTKMMTAYLLFDALRNEELTLDSQLMISKKAWKKAGSKMFLEVGKTVRVEDLIKGILVSSGNDACIVVAEHLAGSEDAFAVAMNDKAVDLGLLNTQFRNASGWPDPEQYTTAKDMYTLAVKLWEDFPEYYKYFSIPSFTYNNIRQPNRNGLITRNVGIDGLKTGHIEDAGYHLVASGERSGERLFSAVLGTDSMAQRENETASGLGFGFRMYKGYNLVPQGAEVEDAPVWLGDKRWLALTVDESLEVYIAKKDRNNLTSEIIYNSPLIAPIEKGTEVGTIQVTNRSTGKVTSVPLIAAESIGEASFTEAMWQKLSQALSGDE